jgi:hypothetical protein
MARRGAGREPGSAVCQLERISRAIGQLHFRLSVPMESEIQQTVFMLRKALAGGGKLDGLWMYASADSCATSNVPFIVFSHIRNPLTYLGSLVFELKEGI